MGSRKTKVPSIPTPTPDNTIEVLNAIKETMEVAEMRRGDKLDAKVTFRDLIKGGLADAGAGLLQPTGIGSGKIGAIPDSSIPGPGSEFLKPPSYDGLVLPGRPSNVHTMAVWDGIQVIWDWPEEENSNIYWKRAVIWASGDSNFDNATIVGTSTVNFFTHTDIGLSTFTIDGVETQPGVRYYWVAWEGLYDVAKGEPRRTETNPYPWEAGIYGKTAVNPEYVLGLMEESISEVHFVTPLNSRIDLVDYNPDDPNNPFTTSVQERILSAAGDASGVYAAIAEVARTSVNQDEGNQYAAGEWSLRIDANGHVAGFGLSAFSSIDGDGVRSEGSAFVISANYFAVGGRPLYVPGIGNSLDQLTPIYPFMVDSVNKVVGINGELVVDGTITANAIQAGSIGVGQLNAIEIYADMMTADHIISGTFSTSSALPNMRVEINGEGSGKELFPLWYGRGATGDSETTVFMLDHTGTVKLAGELYVTGAGKFFAGNWLESGEWRIEIGGPEDEFMLWAGAGTKSKANENYAFWIDNTGTAKFRGTLEAEFVSGEISRTHIIGPELQDRTLVTTSAVTKGKELDNYTDSDWSIAGTWELPYAPFSSGHIPYCAVAFELVGIGQRAGCAWLEWREGTNGPWIKVVASAYGIGDYGETKTMVGVAPRRVTLPSYFRLKIGGFDGFRPESKYRNGIIMGIR